MAEPNRFQPGREKTGGRAPGQKNAKTLLLETIMEKYQDRIDNGTFVTPLSFWLDILQDEEYDDKLRMDASTNLAKYLHSAKATLIEQKVETNIVPSIEINFIGDE